MSKIKRILLKLSGEALMGQYDFGYDPEVLSRVAEEIVAVQKTGVEIALVIGGGNLFRGKGLEEAGLGFQLTAAAQSSLKVIIQPQK